MAKNKELDEKELAKKDEVQEVSLDDSMPLTEVPENKVEAKIAENIDNNFSDEKKPTHQFVPLNEVQKQNNEVPLEEVKVVGDQHEGCCCVIL